MNRRKHLAALAACAPMLAAACGTSTATEAPAAADRTQRDYLTWLVPGRPR